MFGLKDIIKKTLHNNRKVRASINVFKNDVNLQSKQEQFVLKVSMYCALILAIFSISFGIYVKSKVIIFDGFVALVSVALVFISLLTSKYIYKEDDDTFQYGYVRFEPVVNLFKSFILIVICLYAFVGSIASMYKGGNMPELDGAIAYTIITFFLCVGIWLYTAFYGKVLNSPLVKVDSIEWKIDSVLYMGGFIAFGSILIFDPELKSRFSHYIDPLLLMILSFTLATTPVKIFISNMKDLLMIAPKKLDDKLTQIMQEQEEKYGFVDYDTHIAKNGRFYMVEINILMDKNFEVGKLKDLDVIRDEFEKALDIPSYKIWLSVTFTTDPKWL